MKIFACKKSIFIRVLLGISALMLSLSAHALVIDLNYIGSGPKSMTAEAGFQQAAARWESRFQDDVTVRVDWDFAALNPGVLGSTSATKYLPSYYSVRNALLADQTSTADVTATTNLQAGPYLDFVTNGPNSSGHIDSTVRVDATGLDPYNAYMRVTRANAKAIGLLNAHDTMSDAKIKFSSGFSFDFDSSNGIDPGKFDFIGMAAHEIGHALGFVSGVDVVDFNALPDGAFTPVWFSGLERYPIGSTLDLFRYTEDSVSRDLLDWAVGFDPNGEHPFFSIDGGLTELGTFSSGNYNGDDTPQRQASHWEDALGLGLMDPTLAPGELTMFQPLDIIAFDVMGWDLATVPEPGTLMLIAAGLFGVGSTRKRKIYC